MIQMDTALKRMGKDLGVSVVEKKISVSQLKSADEVFLSGTASEIIPVTRIDRNIQRRIRTSYKSHDGRVWGNSERSETKIF